MKPLRPFKRRGYESREAPYYVTFQVKRKRYLWNTRTNDAVLAKRRGEDYRANVVAERFHLVNQMKLRTGMASFADLFAAYFGLPEPKDRTKRRNVSAMEMVLKAAGIARTDPIDRLNAQAALKWQGWAMREGSGITAVSANSTLRMAKSLFSDRALLSYSMEVPRAAVAEFMRVPYLKAARKRPEIPGPEAMRRAHSLLPGHPECYRAFLLCAYAGCRSSEAVAATGDWLELGPQGWIIWIGGRDYQTKTGNYGGVRLVPEVASLLTAPHGHSIVGNPAGDIVRRRLVTMLNGYGFPKKSVQALRRWGASVIDALHGDREAERWLRHRRNSVAEHHYLASRTALAVPFGADLEKITARPTLQPQSPA